LPARSGALQIDLAEGFGAMLGAIFDYPQLRIDCDKAHVIDCQFSDEVSGTT
jgi:hypothetical protein